MRGSTRYIKKKKKKEKKKKRKKEKERKRGSECGSETRKKSETRTPPRNADCDPEKPVDARRTRHSHSLMLISRADEFRTQGVASATPATTAMAAKVAKNFITEESQKKKKKKGGIFRFFLVFLNIFLRLSDPRFSHPTGSPS
jgi:hypothetical protein